MTTRPYEISPAEWAEIIQVRDVREGWGIAADETPEQFASAVYGVRFDFFSGSPGYVGDLFILQGDALEPPMQLIRNRTTGNLEVSA